MASPLADYFQTTPIEEVFDWLREKNVSIREGTGDYEKYFILKYHQFRTPFNDPRLLETRGSIWYKPTKECVCRPFDKFFNEGEKYAHPIDWEKAVVFEKIDGSLMKLWYHNGWHLSTNGVIDAFINELPQNEPKVTRSFGQLFVTLFPKDIWTNLDKEYTYLFEMASPYNRVVVEYTEPTLYHLGSRKTKTGEWVDHDIDVQKPKEYQLSNLKDCLEFVKKNTVQFEGAVVFDGINRVKIKNPLYVSIHKKANLTDEGLLELITNGDYDDIMGTIPELKERINRLQEALNEFISRHEKEYLEWLELEEMKKHQYLKGTRIGWIYYPVWKGKKC